MIRPHPGPLPRGSPCPTSYLLDTVGSDQSLRKSMTTNQLSLLCAANVRVIHFREHLVRRRAQVGLMPCAFASLRLCVLAASVPTQRRREDLAKTRLIRSVIRGQPLLAKLDDLTQRTLGATMSMFNVLVPGNQPSEATTDVMDSTDIYPCHASTGARAGRTEGIASLNPVG